MVKALFKGTTGPIPIPPDPPYQDIADKGGYIPKSLSPELKQRLIDSSQNFADILQMAGMGGTTALSEASENVSHYVSGNGADKTLSDKDVADMQASIPRFRGSVARNVKEFLESVKSQMVDGNLPSGLFILEQAPGDHWVGMQSGDNKKWHYAMGAFEYSIGARAVKNSAVSIEVRYKIYIFDRYNWDMGKIVSMPKLPIDVASSLTGKDISLLKMARTPQGGTYIGQLGGPTAPNYQVDDATLGVLAAAGRADFYSIRGASGENVAVLSVP